jgi:hypothetical protein
VISLAIDSVKADHACSVCLSVQCYLLFRLAVCVVDNKPPIRTNGHYVRAGNSTKIEKAVNRRQLNPVCSMRVASKFGTVSGPLRQTMSSARISQLRDDYFRIDCSAGVCGGLIP